MKTGSSEFTGERFLPGHGGAQIAYEHLHRYVLALDYAGGKRVLDVATGSGYGAALLARNAAEVWAIDLDLSTINAARQNYGRHNLRFLRADAQSLPVRTASMDLVVAFEVLEHVTEPEEMVRELARAVRSDGIVLISTPNKAIYSDARHYRNPYHVREFYREELLALLKEHFVSVRLMEQQVRAGSLILADSAGSRSLSSIALDPPPAVDRTPASSMYFVAACGHERLPLMVPEMSAYLDLTDLLFEDWAVESGRLNREIEKLGQWGKRLEESLKQKDEILRGVLEEVAERDGTILALKAEIDREIERRDRELMRLEGEFQERSRWAESLQRDVEERDATIDRTMADLDRVGAHLARIRHAFLYRVLCRLGILPK